MKYLYYYLALFACSSSLVLAAPCEIQVEALVKRISPELAPSLRFEVIPQVNGHDLYELEQQDDKIMVRASSKVAMASGVYHYLKEYCHCHISRNGNNLKLPSPLPQIKDKVQVLIPVKHFFAYNYCTHGYTMVWWDWEQWERELDLLALQGVNMALIIQGQDTVWQNTFTKFGYTKEEVRQWLCSPAHQPWQFMQNMQGIMPPTQGIIDKRTALGKQIVQRCRELGIEPVLQGYYGMLPSGFSKKHPEAKVLSQGSWAGKNTRPDMIDPSDPLFPKLAATFFTEQEKIFGKCRYFAADPFHEGGKTHDLNRGVVFKQVQDAMLAFDPDATLVKQCWQTSNEEMFAAGRKDRILALDLWCDVKPFWKNSNGYNGTPWMWCIIQNFGGNVGMEANLPRLVKDIEELFASPNRGNLSGLAIMPEGSETDPVVYELLTEMGCRGAPKDINAWIDSYILARYGQPNTDARKAWEIMLKTNYRLTSGQSPLNNPITAAPRIDKNIKGRTWAPNTRKRYDNKQLLAAWKNMLDASRELNNVDSFCFDLADVARQTLSNWSLPLYESMITAYEKKDPEEFKKYSAALLDLIAELDELTATRKEWLMGKWVQDARRWGNTAAEKTYLDRCARMLLTTWVENPHTNLEDYANREWSGLLKEYYLPRWQLFIKTLDNSMKTAKEPDWKIYKKDLGILEVNWINSESEMPSITRGNTVSVAQRLYMKYEDCILNAVEQKNAPAKE